MESIKKLTFDVLFPSGKRVTLVEAMGDMYAYEVIDFLVDEELLPLPHIYGSLPKDYYKLAIKGNNLRVLDMDKTLEANGVCNHDSLIVYPL